jgi:multiple antibiotic resistance protein
MELSQIIENTLYFLALINPASKVLFLASKQPAYSRRELISLSLRSTIVALSILVILTTIGNFLLLTIFHVEIYSLSVAGGIILFIIGLTAVRQGRFFESSKETEATSDVSVVPLAAPLIAGPGTMTAAISFASMHGTGVTLVCITLAVIINLVCMLLSTEINRALEKLNATGPMIRITGLIVTAVAMQMIFSGTATWLTKVWVHVS